jgi:hypothetical protein
MTSTPRLAIGLTCIGLLASMWLVRPSDPWLIQDWVTSLWFVAAWSVPIVASLGRAYAAVIGAVVVLFATQVWFYVMFDDAMIFVIKPLVELPLSALGGWVGYLVESQRKRQTEPAALKEPS